jgi:hypothetical protein
MAEFDWDKPQNDVPDWDKPSVVPVSSVPKTTTGQGSKPVTDVLNRALVAGTIGFPVDIAAMAMRPFGYKEPEPVMGSEWIGKQMEKAGLVTPTRRPIAEFATGLAPALLTGGASALSKVPGVVRTLAGAPAKTAAEALKAKSLQQLETPLSEAEKARAQSAKVIEEMERQSKVASERAANRPLTEQQLMAQLQAELRDPARQAAAAQKVKAAGAVSEAELRTKTAEDAVDALEKSLLAKPTISAEQFGSQLRNVTKQLHKDLVDARETGSGFKQVLADAGDAPIVNTTPVINQAIEMAKKSRNPAVISMMNEIASLAKTNGKKSLSLESADSLRKVLSKDIINKYFPQAGADKEVLNSLKVLRRELINQTPQAYKEALGKFSVLSRPLDILERQGALRKVIDVDPLSTAEKLSEAEVVGQIINKSRAGHPVFSRLLEASPQLKESARLYFTKDLFSKDVVPTEAVLSTWLKTNEKPLRQLGLFDEFKNIRTAKETAQRSLEEAKLSQAAASSEAKVKQRLSEESQKRLSQALKLSEAKQVPTKAPSIQTFIQSRDKADATINSLNTLQSNIRLAKTPKEVRDVVQGMAQKLLRDGVIDDAGMRTISRELQNLRSLEDAQTKARKVAGSIAIGAAALSGISYTGRNIVSESLK